MNGLGVNELKKRLKSMEQKELIQLICDLYKTNKYVKMDLDSKLNAEISNPVMTRKYILQIQKALDYTRGRFDIKKAKDQVKEFCQCNHDLKSQADVYLAFIESAVELTVELGDINERFYNDVVNTTWKYVEVVNQLDERIIASYYPRLRHILYQIQDIGWGFEDEMYDAFYNIDGFCNE